MNCSMPINVRVQAPTLPLPVPPHYAAFGIAYARLASAVAGHGVIKVAC